MKNVRKTLWRKAAKTTSDPCAAWSYKKHSKKTMYNKIKLIVFLCRKLVLS